MKKLVLVTLLAVSASWLLSEARQPGPRRPSSAETREFRLVTEAPRVGVQDVPEPARSIRTVPWRKADTARSKRVASGPKAAKPMPPWFPKSEIDEEAKAQPDSSGFRVLVGRLSASEKRAREDLLKAVESEIADWLAADVPTTWKVPSEVIASMAREGTYVQEVTRSLKSFGSWDAPEIKSSSTPEVAGLDDLYTLYRAGQRLDFSSHRRALILERYRRELAAQRMQRLGGGLALALAALAVLSGYIKADEATKGYYTNRLRLAAAAGLGAAGVVAYRFLA